MSKPVLPSAYAPLFAELKSRVRAAQVKAAVAVNRELILLYWHIGREILRAQKAEGWGTKVVERLAKDLAAEFPEMGGFSFTNLMRMRTFAGAYVTEVILPQAVGELALSIPGGEIFPQPVGKLAEADATGAIVAQPVRQSRKSKGGQIVQQPVAKLPGAVGHGAGGVEGSLHVRFSHARRGGA